MFFDNNAKEKQINVNTNITTLWSDTSSLTIGCWNDKISLSWLPAIGKDADGLTKYDKDQRISTSLSHVKIAVLLKRFKERVQPAYEKSEDPGDHGKSAAVPIVSKDGSTAALMLEYRKDDSGKPGMYLTLARKMTETGTSKENIIRYHFNKISVMDDMSPEEGGGTIADVDGELEFFLDILRSHVLMTGLNSHATRYSNAFSKRGSNSASTDASMNVPFESSGSFSADGDGFTVFQ